jgi:hypothetical protein
VADNLRTNAQKPFPIGVVVQLPRVRELEVNHGWRAERLATCRPLVYGESRDLLADTCCGSSSSFGDPVGGRTLDIRRDHE